MNDDRFDHLLELHCHEVLHDATDRWTDLEVAAAVRNGGGAVLIGEHSVTPSEARLLARSLEVLAAVAEPVAEPM